MIEVLIAISVVMVAMLAAVSTLTSTAILGQSNDETTIATQGARSAMEVLRGLDFQSILPSYNSDPNDDPGGVGTAPGIHFEVPGLSVQDGDTDGFVGRVLLPFDASESLVENLDLPQYGMPRDLNGDGSIDGIDHSSDHIILPVLIVVEWTGRTGNRRIEFSTIVGQG